MKLRDPISLGVVGTMVVEVHEIQLLTLCSLLFTDSHSPARAINSMRIAGAYPEHDLLGLTREIKECNPRIIPT